MAVRQSSLRLNAVANYVAQFYVVVVGIVMVPVYLAYMGAEAYGLVGFFVMLSAWFQLLDMGLTPTLVREAARFRGGAIGAETLRNFLRALEFIFGGFALAAGGAIILLSKPIASGWLNAQHLSADDVALSIALMGLTIPLRWMSSLYRGVISGFERQVWLSGYGIAISTMRFVGVLAVFETMGATPVHFFSYQLVIAALELVVMGAMSYRLMGARQRHSGGFTWKPFLDGKLYNVHCFCSDGVDCRHAIDKLLLSTYCRLHSLVCSLLPPLRRARSILRNAVWAGAAAASHKNL